jgi:hypothetical protein
MRKLTVALFFVLALPLEAGVIRRAVIDLPDDFAAAAEEQKVDRAFWTHSKAPMKFGSYAVTEHHRGWERTRSSSTPVTPPWFPVRAARNVEAGKSSSEHSYAFTLVSAGSPRWRAACLTRSKSEELTVIGIPVKAEGTADLICRLASVEDESQVWTLSIHERGSLQDFSSNTNGELTDGTRTLSIDPVRKYEGSDFEIPGAVGLTVSENDAVVGAVDLAGNGSIFLGREGDAASRDLIAAALAAVLLNQ